MIKYKTFRSVDHFNLEGSTPADTKICKNVQTQKSRSIRNGGISAAVTMNGQQQRSIISFAVAMSSMAGLKM